MPMGFWTGAEKAKDSYDDWATTAKAGEDITVSGMIGNKEETEIMGLTLYSYKFNGCDQGFYSGEDIGGKGSMVVLTIRMTEMGPEVYSQTNSFAAWIPNICCGTLSIVFVILGLILMLVGLKKDKKAALERPPEQEKPVPEPVPVYVPVDPIEASKTRQHELNNLVAMQTGWNPEQPPRK